MARLFVAVWPPPEVVARLAAMPRPDDTGLRWTTPGQWHVTLRFLGETDLDAAAVALDAVEHESVTARMGPGAGLLGRNAVVIAVTGLDDLAASVGSAFTGIGRPPEGRPFHGHLTLARIAASGRFTLPAAVPEAEWPVTEIALVRSTLLAAGARYETVRAVALRPRTS